MDSLLESAWLAAQGKLLFPPEPRHPYYIAAPPWTYSSAGIRALYLLCHALNRMGYVALITNHPFSEYRHPWTTKDLMAPLLEKEIATAHFQQGLTPIIVYPEVVSGNPLQAPVVARWVMNFPGLLGGDDTYDLNEIIFGYSRELAIAAGSPERILHMPTVDTRIFHPSDRQIERKGSCFFAYKFKTIHHGELLPITNGCFEITRDQPDSPLPREVAEILKRSEVFYTYENTALAIEAVLCGCPAVFLPNPHLTKMIAKDELGSEGYAWGAEPKEIERARATVAQGAINYLKTYDIFWQQLSHFIAITQERARNIAYGKMTAIPSWPEYPPTDWRKHFFRIKKEWRRCGRKLTRWVDGLFPTSQGSV